MCAFVERMRFGSMRGYRHSLLETVGKGYQGERNRRDTKKYSLSVCIGFRTEPIWCVDATEHV